VVLIAPQWDVSATGSSSVLLAGIFYGEMIDVIVIKSLATAGLFGVCLY